ncbi:TPA: DUF2737 family protein [Enterobacter bugandensis]|jgi:hypothetical protein|uniref:DUF2737 family protein n=1 Tax=Enterobacteriaceae TaxID=543 RepID=UPI00090819AC|nr:MULTISPECIES: DUF2737 family protein [Enterobacteriaceae]MBL7389774.1 DUF2737 family protein [Escherichia coli]UWH33017.1 DUF2737 family protein [Escherichia coli]UWH37681.1 DUF2737 family protein [Escherichia coli]
MIGNSYALQGFYPEEIVARHRFKPINDIPREEMLKKNSFPSVNENKFLTAWLNQRAKK